MDASGHRDDSKSPGDVLVRTRSSSPGSLETGAASRRDSPIAPNEGFSGFEGVLNAGQPGAARRREPGNPASSEKPGAGCRSEGQGRQCDGGKQWRIENNTIDISSRHEYLTTLCQAMMRYGAPTHRLEEFLSRSAFSLNVKCQLLYLPGCMVMSFQDDGSELKLVRATPGIELGKMRDVHYLCKQVVHDRTCVHEVKDRLDGILGSQEKFNKWLRVPVFGLASAFAAPFAFHGRFIDMPIAFVLGCILGLLQLVVAPQNELYLRVLEIAACIISSFLARAIGSIWGGQLFCFSALAQSAIALILPGFTIVCSSLELQSQKMSAGSARMGYALLYTLSLGYSMTIGATLYGLVDRNASSALTCQEPLGQPWKLLFCTAFTLCLCVVCQAEWPQMPVIVAIAVAGFAVNSYSTPAFHGQTHMSTTLGAFAVSILANLYIRLGRHFYSAWLHLPGRCRTWSGGRKADGTDGPVDVEAGRGTRSAPAHTRENQVGRKKSLFRYGPAAAIMLPAIFVQVPSNLAVEGSLLWGVKSADQILERDGDFDSMDVSTVNMLLGITQVAVGVTIGLFLGALIIYPVKGKKKGGLLSF